MSFLKRSKAAAQISLDFAEDNLDKLIEPRHTFAEGRAEISELAVDNVGGLIASLGVF